MNVPKLRHNKTTNRAVVTLSGKDIWLGKSGSRESERNYNRVVAEWLANERKLPAVDDEEHGASVSRLVAEFIKHARKHYRKRGELTTEFESMRRICRLVNGLYGKTPTAEFGPKKFKIVRQKWIDKGNSRQTINKDASRLKTIFAFGVENELVEPSVNAALKQVKGLKVGRTEGVEDAPKVKAVSRKIVDQTLPRLSSVVADMVSLNILLACRPGELCVLTPGQIKRDRDVWEFRYAEHKMAGKFSVDGDRVIFFGPRAQAILAKYLDRPDDAFCFSPAESLEQTRAARSKERVTPASCGNRRQRKGVGGRFPSIDRLQSRF